MKPLIFDIDGLLSKEKIGNDYANRTPNETMCQLVRDMKAKGYTILIYTARWPEDYAQTILWLEETAGVPFDGLTLNKPAGVAYFDDLALPGYIENLHKWLNYNMSNNCWRAKNGHDMSEESHDCYMCGEPIPISTGDCEICGIMKCPSCGHCLCTMPLLSKITLFRIHNKYCCNLPRFVAEGEKIELGGFVDMTVIQNATKALTTCCINAGLLA